MIGVIVAGHGNFATGITSMLRLVVGELESYQCIDFVEGEALEDLEEEFEQKIKLLSGCEYIVIMTDIAGGSPYKTALTNCFTNDKLEVIAGTNIPMLVELIFGRRNENNRELMLMQVIKSGREQITRFDRSMICAVLPENH